MIDLKHPLVVLAHRLLHTTVARLGVGFLALAAVLSIPGHANAQIPPQITTYYYTDQVGSPIAAADKNGNVLWREMYTPFGKRLLASAPSSPNSNLWFSGSLETKGTGLLYMGARHYDPNLGRFMGPDPVGFAEEDPGSFGRYTYAANNPYSFNDPNGDFANFVLGGLKAGVENAVIQYAEINLGTRDQFSLSELATDAAIGTVTSGLSTLKNSTRLARIVEKAASKADQRRLVNKPSVQRSAARGAQVLSEPIYKTTKEAKVAAEALGFKKINETVHEGQAVFKRGKDFITRDLDGHNGGAWKMADSVKNLGSKETRSGTFDVNFNRIGD